VPSRHVRTTRRIMLCDPPPSAVLFDRWDDWPFLLFDD
jgi:hypothetical protein